MKILKNKIINNCFKSVIFLSFTIFTTLQFAKVGSYLNENKVDITGYNYATFQANILRYAAITVDTHTGKTKINSVQDALISEYIGVYSLLFVFMECSLLNLASFYLFKIILK